MVMVGTGRHEQVLRPVVVPDAIQVVNDLIWPESTPKCTGCDQAVFRNIVAAGSHLLCKGAVRLGQDGYMRLDVAATGFAPTASPGRSIWALRVLALPGGAVLAQTSKPSAAVRGRADILMSAAKRDRDSTLSPIPTDAP